jgi:hypothetical protein
MRPQTEESGRPSTGRERTAALVIGCALTALFTYPTVARFTTFGRVDGGDGRFSIWNVAWIAHSLVEDPRRLFDANIFYPHLHTLTYSELNLVAGLLATPVYALTRNPIAAHNSAVLAGLLLTFMSMWALVHRLTMCTRAGLVSATAYTFAAYTSSHTSEIQLLMLFGFPIVMLAFHALAEQPGPAVAVWLGAGLALTGLACGYYGVFAAALVVVAAIWWGVRRRDYWMALGIAVLTSILLVMPVLGLYLHYRAADNVARIVRIQDLAMYSADWRSYAMSSSDLGGVWTLPLSKMGPVKDVMFPGIFAIVFAAIGVGMAWRGRIPRRLAFGYLVIAALACWASFGPAGGLYVVFARTLPGGMSFLRAPGRLGVVVTFALCVLAGLGYKSVARNRHWLAPVAMAFLVVELWVAWPLHAMEPIPRAYRMLALLPRGAVVEFPFPYHSWDMHRHTQAMLRSMWNWQPLVNGYSDHIPADFYEIALPINRFPDPESFEIMRARNVRYVVVRVNDYAAPYRATLLARFPPYEANLRLLTDDQNVRLYEIVSWPPTPSTETETVRKR